MSDSHQKRNIQGLQKRQVIIVKSCPDKTVPTYRTCLQSPKLSLRPWAFLPCLLLSSCCLCYRRMVCHQSLPALMAGTPYDPVLQKGPPRHWAATLAALPTTTEGGAPTKGAPSHCAQWRMLQQDHQEESSVSHSLQSPDHLLLAQLHKAQWLQVQDPEAERGKLKPHSTTKPRDLLS